jgi:CRP/FNR family transcriptional regulator, cyclic AMP receptor protein
MLKSLNLLNLFSHSDAVAFAAGDVVFRESEVGETMYVVKSGSVVLTAGDRVLETLSAGALFGEMALIDSDRRSATATASSACELVVIDERRFQFLVRETPFFAQHVMRVMANRLRQMNRQAGGPSDTAP